MQRRVKDFYLNELERYILYLKKLSPSQIEQLKSGSTQILFVLDGEKGEDVLVVTPENKEHVSILMSIEQMQSKKEVENYLNSLHLKRNALEEMCRFKDIPFTKRDNMTVLKDKIYERVVGFKLRSQAIQNDVK